jgi:hypothetical protein
MLVKSRVAVASTDVPGSAIFLVLPADPGSGFQATFRLGIAGDGPHGRSACLRLCCWICAAKV